MPKKTLMLVDDDATTLKLLETLFKLEGYNIVKAQSGYEALKKLKKVKPDLMLLDFFMPEISGREVCEKIRADKKLKNLNVAFLTVATFSKQGIEELKQMNVIDYIQKPFSNIDLIERVKKVTG